MVRPIGSGSFGQVFLVVHRAEQKEFVMKSIELHTSNPESREATEMEVKLLSSMRHPNIVLYRESFVDQGGYLCIVMEYCEHGDIYSYIQEAKKVQRYPDENRLLSWFIQIALALHALHRKKILHRDLKTQNIFLTGNKAQGIFALKLGDFGIARVLDSTSDLAKTQIGTPFYMSPELINNKPYGTKSDVWGLGCILYEIVHGHRAFDAQSLNGLALKIIKGAHNSITVNCSAGTKALIKSMLSTKAKNRPFLREIMLNSTIRPRISRTVGNVIAAGSPESRVAVEQALAKQLASLGIGAPGQGRKRDSRKLEQQLRKAEMRVQREEEVLQHTVALLEQCLHGDDPAHPLGVLHEGIDERKSPRSVAGGHSRSRFGSFNTNVSPRNSETSHRLRRSHSRLDEEGRGSVVHHRMGVSERRERFMSGGLYGEHGQASQKMQPSSRPHARSEDTSNSVRRTSSKRGIQEPNPPPVQYGEPHPPRELPNPGGASGFRMGDFGASNAAPARPRMPTDRLEAISGTASNLEQEQTRLPPSSGLGTPPPSDVESNSLSSGSLTEVQELEEWEGLSDASEEREGQRPQALQQRISQCQAAICRHRMTIEMLEFAVAQGQDQQPAPQNASSSGGLEVSHWPTTNEDSGGMRRPAVPAVVQDCSARLARRCTEGLGNEKFQAAKRCLQASLDAAELPDFVRARMLELLGVEKIGFLSMLEQLVHMERRWDVTEVL